MQFQYMLYNLNASGKTASINVQAPFKNSKRQMSWSSPEHAPWFVWT